MSTESHPVLGDNICWLLRNAHSWLSDDGVLMNCAADDIEEMRKEIKQLREYVEATQYWKIEPADSQERRAHLVRLGVISINRNAEKS